MASIIHWKLLVLHGFERCKNWYNHTVFENDDPKIPLDFNINSDKVIEPRRPDTVADDKQNFEVVNLKAFN